MGPALSTVNGEEQWSNTRAWYQSTSNGPGLWRVCAHRIWTPTSAQARFKTKNGGKARAYPRVWHQSTSNTGPAHSQPPPCSRELAGPLGPGKGKSGGGPSMLANPPCSRSRTPSRITFTAASVMGPWSCRRLEIATAQAGSTRLGAQHLGTSRRQTPTRAHARFRAGNGEVRGRTQHARSPATVLLANPQPHRRFNQGPMVASPPRNCHSASRVHPALGTVPARGS